MRDDERCRARSKRTGNQCTKRRVPGATVCRYHGAAAPQVARKAEARVAVATFGLPKDIDPHTALLQEVHAVAGNVSYLRSIVGELEQGELKQYQISSVASEDGEREIVRWERPSVWVEMYWQAHDRLIRVCAAAIKAGIEERRVHLAEKQGEMLALCIRGILTELGVIDRPEVPSIVRKHLELVVGENGSS